MHGTFTVVQCLSHDPDLQDYFIRFAKLAIDALDLQRSGSNLDIIIRTIVKLLESLSLPPSRASRGLWAELFLINFCSDPTELVESWHAIPQEIFDFAQGQQRLEVKGMGGNRLAHNFSMGQLNPPRHIEVVVPSIEVRNSVGGKSVEDLIADLSLQLGLPQQRKVWGIAVSTLGTDWLRTAPMRFDFEHAKETLKFFDARDIPRINPSHCPPEVSDVHFTSELSKVRSLSFEDLRARGRLIAAAAPPVYGGHLALSWPNTVGLSAAIIERPEPEFHYKFRHLVGVWAEDNLRAFPWRQVSNPFHILVAEVLLRQTQAERVAGPYRELISMYPHPAALAEADPRTLRRWFKPLGLVTRAVHLISASRQIRDLYDGQVPRDLAALTKLPGIGTYSARAILCMAFGEPVPMVDESSGRLLRRMLGLRSNGPAYSDRKLLDVAESLIPEDGPREFNLALLDIAASICRPKNPSCRLCPLADMCEFAGSTKRKGCAEEDI